MASDDEVDVTGGGMTVHHKYKHNHKHEHKYKEGKTMHGTEGVNIFASSPMGTGAGMGGGGFGHDGFGGLGGVGGVLLGALLGRGLLGGGFGGFGGPMHCGDGGGVERPVFDAAILGKLGTIEGSVPLSASQTQNAITAATGLINNNALQVALSQSQQNAAFALSNQQQLAGVKDAVQNGVYANTLATIDQGEKTRALITATRIAELEANNTTLSTTLLLERHGRSADRDTHGLVIQNTNTANAMQTQQQQQGFAITRLFDMMHNCDQNIRATNQAINIGSGAQVATPTNTSTNNRVN